MKLWSREYYEFAGNEFWALAQAIRETETGNVKNPELAMGDSGRAFGGFQMHESFMQEQFVHPFPMPTWVLSNPYLQAAALRLFFLKHDGLNAYDLAGIYHNGAAGWVKMKATGDPYVDKVLSRMNDIIAKEKEQSCQPPTQPT